MRTGFQTRAALGLLGALLLLFACTAGEREPEAASQEPTKADAVAVREIVFGVYTSDSATEMVKKFSPMLKAIELGMTERLGEPVRIQLKVSATYEGGVTQLVAGEVDFSRLGPASYVMATEMDEGVELLAMESKKGEKVFRGVICVHSDSPTSSLDGLRGKRFAFGNERSTIGRYLAQKSLLDVGISESDLAGFEYLGRHDKVGMAVGRGQFDAGALKEGTFKKLIKAGEQIRALAYFDNVTKPWVARPNLDPKVLEALRQTLLEISDPEALAALKKDGFLVGTDSDYDVIRAAIRASENFAVKRN